jgi:hypothetical protein
MGSITHDLQGGTPQRTKLRLTHEHAFERQRKLCVPGAFVPGAARRDLAAELLEVEDLRGFLLDHVGEERDPEAALLLLAVVFTPAVLAIPAIVAIHQNEGKGRGRMHASRTEAVRGR